MTAKDVRQLDTEGLCRWLKNLLTANQWKVAGPVIRKKMIEGLNFLDCPEAKWEEFGLEWGVANSLFKIAQSVVRAEATIVGEEGGDVITKVPAIDMNSIQDILDFLTSHMRDPSKFNCEPHVLSETKRSFALSGRDDALNSAAKAFKNLVKDFEASDRIERKIPVCSGLSGLGKTRMLEEWERIFDLAEIPSPRLGALVLYYNGHAPESKENAMPIEASFSWRLLHRLFLERNGPKFSKFMSTMLPKNAMDLRLETALEVIRSHLVARGDVLESGCLHMFLGIDEYQSILKMNATSLSQKGGLLQDLLDALVNILSDPVDGIRLYPMFAGTDFSVMSNIANSSTAETIRIPMTLLTAAEVEQAVGALPFGATLLGYSPVRRHLFYFGGVARWATQYMEELLTWMEESQGSEVPSSKCIESAFTKIRGEYVNRWQNSLYDFNSLQHDDILYLAAYSISGRSVYGDFRGKMSWSRLRDSSVCLIDDNNRVTVPYALFHFISTWNPAESSPSKFNKKEEQAFILTLKSLISNVDDMVYSSLRPWQLWEVFGAHFHALRINALMILGHKKVLLRELFLGALVNGCDQWVLLKPMEVIQTGDVFSRDLGESVGIKGHSNDRKDWRKGGYVVLNGEGGKGVDIFFCLEKADASGEVVITDQRKREFKPLGALKLDNLVNEAKMMPSSVVCIFSCFASTRLKPEEIPKDTCVVSFAQTEAYHGSLWIHPAASPCVNVNSDSISYLKMVFKGKDSDEFCRELVNERLKQKFSNMKDLKMFISAKKKKLNIRVNVADMGRIIF